MHAHRVQRGMYMEYYRAGTWMTTGHAYQDVKAAGQALAACAIGSKVKQLGEERIVLLH